MAEPIRITLLGDASDLSRALNDAGEEVSAFGEKAKGLALAAGAGIAAGIGLGVMEALDQEMGSDLLAAQLGASPAEAQRLGEAAGAIYAGGWGESVADANEALKSLWQQGLIPAGATADEMENIGTKTMDVANILGEELGPTSNAVGQMLKTGMAKDAAEAFDILTVGAQNGSNKAEDLLDTFNEYSVQFKRVGLDGKTSLGLISQGLQGGARDADQVADAIGQFGERALAGGTEVDDAYASIGLSAEDMAAKIGKGGSSAEEALAMTLDALRGTSDEQTKLNAAAALFGDPANVMGDALYALDPATAAAQNGLDNVDGAAKRAGDTLNDNAATKVKEFTRSLQQGVVEFLGVHVIPAIETLAGKLSWLGTAFSAVSGFVSRFSTPLTVLAGILTVILLPAMVAWGVTAIASAAANIAAWLTSSAASTTGAATQVLAHWAVVGGWIRVAARAVIAGAIVVAQWILMGTQAMIQAARMAAAWIISMGPVAWIIALIIGLALIIWTNWDNIKKWTLEAWDWVWQKIKDVFGFLTDLFLNFSGPGLLIKHWDTIKRATVAAFDWIVDKVGDGIDSVVGYFDALPGRILGLVGRIGAAARAVGQAIIDSLGSGLAKTASFANDIGDSVVRALKASVNGIVSLLNTAIPNKMGIGSISVDLPDNPIPSIRAMGGPASGAVRVGERGPETVLLPKGSSVTPNHASDSGAGVVVNVATNADPFAIGREVAWALRTQPA